MVCPFAAHHKGGYIEVALESPDTPHLLEQQVGISAECWGDCELDKASEHYKPIRLDQLQPDFFVKFLLTLSDTMNNHFLK